MGYYAGGTLLSHIINTSLKSHLEHVMKIHAVPDKPAGITYSFLSGDHQARIEKMY